MEKLMKPAEYAKELGISRQAVYAKIKRGILKAKEVEGKLYIVVPESTEKRGRNDDAATSQKRAETTKNASSKRTTDYAALLAAKDETIAVLKETVNDLKESNKQITGTLKGEIDLLKEAFYEMRMLYTKQIADRTKSLTTEEATIEAVETLDVHPEEPEYIGLKKYCKRYGIDSEKKRMKLRKAVKKAYKSGDTRIFKEEGKYRIAADLSPDTFLD